MIIFNCLVTGATLTFIVMGIIGITKGYRQEAVFFYNYWDLFLAPISLFVAVIACILITNKSSGNMTNALSIGAIAPFMLWAVANMYVAFRFNPSKRDAICVGIGRMLVGFGSIFILMSFLANPLRQKGDSDPVHAAKFTAHKVFWVATGYWFVELSRKLVKGGRNG
jgi:uncharacterized membrane protein